MKNNYEKSMNIRVSQTANPDGSEPIKWHGNFSPNVKTVKGLPIQQGNQNTVKSGGLNYRDLDKGYLLEGLK